MADRYQAEAVVLLAWSQAEGYKAVVPHQVSYVNRSWPLQALPLKVTYEWPSLPAGFIPVGYVHSHVYMDADSSWVDAADVRHFTGIHLVLGRLDCEPPDIQCTFPGTE